MHTSLTRDEFLRRYGNLFHALYSSNSPSRSSFRNQQWRFVLTSRKFLMDPVTFDALSRAIKTAGDEEIVVTEMESHAGNPAHLYSVIVPCSYQDYRAAMDLADIGYLACMNTAIFGPSGSWAAIVDRFFHHTGYTIFGAQDEIMDAWLEALGGIDAVRNAFTRLWPTSGRFRLDPELRKNLFANVGW